MRGGERREETEVATRDAGRVDCTTKEVLKTPLQIGALP